jgi:hypothetical protein
MKVTTRDKRLVEEAIKISVPSLLDMFAMKSILQSLPLVPIARKEGLHCLAEKWSHDEWWTLFCRGGLLLPPPAQL